MPLWRYLVKGGKRASAIWHRRAGKDELCLHITAVKMMERVGNYWHMLPLQTQARRAIWDAVNPHTGIRRIDEAFPKEIRETTREQEMMIRFVNGSTWNVVGSDSYNALVGSPPIGLIYSEWALSDPASWAYLRPIMLENDGWAAFITTPRGKNHAWRTHQTALEHDDHFAQILTALDTGVFTEEQLAAERLEYIAEYGEDLGTALFAQEYMCSFDAAIVGAYYGKELRDAELQGRITRVPYDPSLEVETWWDLGVRDATAIWFIQRDPTHVRVIDYYANSGVGLPHYADVLRNKGYNYGMHVGPHDIDVREFSSGRSRRETARDMGIEFTVAPKFSLADGINAVRTLLPLCYFDAEKCADGLDALRSYRTEWDEKNRIMKAQPIHDWTSHPADAFRTGAVMRKPASRSDWDKPISNIAGYSTGGTGRTYAWRS